jgi:hypothetical protein
MHLMHLMHLMQRAIAVSRRLLACIRGAALVGYTSLMLLFAVAAIAVLGHSGGGAKSTHSANITPSD